MFCPSCGARNAIGAQTCLECAKPLPMGRSSLAPVGGGPAHALPELARDAAAQPVRPMKRPAPLVPPPLDVVPLRAAADEDARPPPLLRPAAQHTEAVYPEVPRPVAAPRAWQPRPAHAAEPFLVAEPLVAEPSVVANQGVAPMAALPSLARWLGAALVDGVVASAAAEVAIVGALAARAVPAAWQPIVDSVHADVVLGLATLLVPPLLAIVLVQLASVSALGATIGQRLAGLVVVRARDGEAPGFGRAGVRALFGALGVSALLAGPLWGLCVDRRYRGLGDLVAGTVVVRRSPSVPAMPREHP